VILIAVALDILLLPQTKQTAKELGSHSFGWVPVAQFTSPLACRPPSSRR